MNTETSAKADPNPLAGISIVDADTHITEWHDLWTSRAPASLKDRVPQIREIKGKPTWTIDGGKSLGINSACSAIRKDGTKAVGLEFYNWQIPDVIPGAYDVKARVAHMDEMGIAAQIAYPNVLGFGGWRSGKLDPELRVASTKIYNDAMAELQAESGNRIFPMALMPWWDVKQAVAEAERCHKMGMKGVNTNTDPHSQDLPSLSDPHWYPLWETCIDLDMPVNFHVGASDESMTWFGTGQWPSMNDTEKFAFGSSMLYLGNARVLSNIIISRMLERYPKLKMVSVESGVGWMPFMLEALEYQMLEAGIKFELRPIELFQRQIFACAWFERRDFVYTARSLGVNNIMFETDYPHPTCLYPNSLERAKAVATDFTVEERQKIYGGNATRLYNLPIS